MAFPFALETRIHNDFMREQPADHNLPQPVNIICKV